MTNGKWTVKYNTASPACPEPSLLKIENMDLFKLIRGSHLREETVGFVVGVALTPAGVFNLNPTTNLEVTFDGTSGASSRAHTEMAKLNALTEWPSKYQMGKVHWFNQWGQVIYPLFEAKPNVIGLPHMCLQFLCTAWSEQSSPRWGVLFDAEGHPRKFGPHQLTVMLLALMPQRCITSVLTRFGVLGSGFLRYFIYTATELDLAASKSIVKPLVSMGKFAVYNTTKFLRELSVDPDIWRENG